jgi:hypothetical protein
MFMENHVFVRPIGGKSHTNVRLPLSKNGELRLLV